MIFAVYAQALCATRVIIQVICIIFYFFSINDDCSVSNFIADWPVIHDGIPLFFLNIPLFTGIHKETFLSGLQKLSWTGRRYPVKIDKLPIPMVGT